MVTMFYMVPDYLEHKVVSGTVAVAFPHLSSGSLNKIYIHEKIK
jgi:hypothetical protein